MKREQKKVHDLQEKLKRWAALSMYGMFIVLLGGALVTNTDSGRGCGTDWPLCNGKFIPAYTIESMIEYSHRMVSGIVGIIIVLTFVMIWRHVRDRKDIRFYAGSALFFTMLQAFLGFMAVKWEQSPVVMALHFGISLLAFASTILLYIEVRRMHLPAHPSGWGLAQMREVKMGRGIHNFIWLTAAYIYIVVYLGAFVRHTDSGGGCVGWPLCNGQVIPEMTQAAAVVFAHRVAALLLLIVTLILIYTILQNPLLRRKIGRISVAIGCLMVAQILSGAFVVFTIGTENLYLASSLIHNVIISVLFGLMCYLCSASWLMTRED